MNYRYTRLSRHDRAERGVLLSATLPDIFPAHRVCSKKTAAYLVGAYALEPGTRRANNNVVAATMLPLDVDWETDGPDDEAAKLATVRLASQRLEHHGIEHVLYTSHSHGRVKENPPHNYVGYRLIIPFATELTAGPGALPRNFRALAKRIVQIYALPGKILALSQPWYVASCPREYTHLAEYRYVPGKPLDWTAAPISYSVTAPAAVADPTLVTAYAERYASAPPKSVTPAEVRARLRKLGMTPALWAVFDARAVDKTEFDRHHEIVLPVTRDIARVSEPGEEAEDLLEVMRPWCIAMQAAHSRPGSNYKDEEGGGWWEECLRALEGALAKVPEWRALDEAFPSAPARPPPQRI